MKTFFIVINSISVLSYVLYFVILLLAIFTGQQYLKLVMSQLILSEMEYRYPQCTLVTVEEEPGVLYGIKISHDMQFAGWRVAFSTHDGNLAPFFCHINNNQ